MPLVKRQVEPIYVSRTKLDKSVKNELEGVAANTLAGVIRQLSSLSKHAENVFTELFNESSAHVQRYKTLKTKVDHLTGKLKEMKSRNYSGEFSRSR